MRLTLLLTATSILAFGLLTACGQPDEEAREETDTAEAVAPEAAETATLTLKAVGLTFEGPGEAPSGWTTIRLENLSDMAHFAVLQRLPDGVTTLQQSREVAPAFQAGYEELAAGNVDQAMAAFGTLPAWYGNVVFMGGPGMVSGSEGSGATVYLTPGRYTLECYVKTNGVFHSYSPNPDVVAMLHELVVTEAAEEAPEPEATVTVSIGTEGYEIVDGAFMAGENIVRVNYETQQPYANFVGHDLHVARLEESTDRAALTAWMDWRVPGGLETPSPAVFVGGLNEMPAGEHGYFTVALEAGDYALIAEVPDPESYGLMMDITIP